MFYSWGISHLLIYSLPLSGDVDHTFNLLISNKLTRHRLSAVPSVSRECRRPLWAYSHRPCTGCYKPCTQMQNPPPWHRRRRRSQPDRYKTYRSAHRAAVGAGEAQNAGNAFYGLSCTPFRPVCSGVASISFRLPVYHSAPPTSRRVVVRRRCLFFQGYRVTCSTSSALLLPDFVDIDVFTSAKKVSRVHMVNVGHGRKKTPWITGLMVPAQLKLNWNKTVKQIPFRVDNFLLKPSHNTVYMK